MINNGQFKQGQKPWNYKGMTKICQLCGERFSIIPSRALKAKYCSNKCSNRRGFVKNTGKTHFKAGSIPWNKEKKTGIVPKSAFKLGDERVIGDNNSQWRGNAVGYAGLHDWVARTLGKPDTCEHCGRSGLSGKFIQWANKSGHYLRDSTDWIRLCAKCHFRYDNKDFGRRTVNG